jgi:hypothetical protein
MLLFSVAFPIFIMRLVLSISRVREILRAEFFPFEKRLSNAFDIVVMGSSHLDRRDKPFPSPSGNPPRWDFEDVRQLSKGNQLCTFFDSVPHIFSLLNKKPDRNSRYDPARHSYWLALVGPNSIYVCPLASLLKRKTFHRKEIATFWTSKIRGAVVFEFCSRGTDEKARITFYNDNLTARRATNIFHLSPPFIATK